jgi:2-oxoglutarate ferredoxin oxidoreductase subunit beta
MNYKDFVRWERMPTTWCGGCAIGTVFKHVTYTLEKMNIRPEELVVVSGIGCSGRAAGYFNVDSVHVTHGRAIPVAEGIKRGNPDLHVVVFSGDGDLTGIGGNHFLHASRRDIDLTVICINNQIYGMTGGQMAPTTELGSVTLTSLSGHRYFPFNVQAIATANPRHYYARTSAFQLNHMEKSFRGALEWKGFAFVDVISFCIENNGRRLGYRFGHEMLMKMKKDYQINRDPSGRLQDHELGIIANENKKDPSA